MTDPAPPDRNEVRALIAARRPGYAPEWRPAGPGAALAESMAHLADAVRQRWLRVPEHRALAFLSLLGAELQPARAARAPVAFAPDVKAPAGRVPAGTRVTGNAAGTAQPVVFETETTIGISPARLAEAVSFWPARDQYIDHSADLAAGRPVVPFRRADLIAAPHAIYLAHDTLIALSGKVSLLVHLQLDTLSPRPLRLAWEYWDGAVWRAFHDFGSDASRDGTEGLTRSGPVQLRSAFAETATLTLAGTASRWIRGRLTTPLVAGDANAPAVLPTIDVVELSVKVERPLPPHSTEAPKEDPLAGKGVVPRGLPLDAAFADSLPLDVSKTFFPFGPAPQPGAAFYWALDEMMAKPGAAVTLRLTPAMTPQRNAIVSLTAPHGTTQVLSALDISVVWEYWDGHAWAMLAVSQTYPKVDYTKSLPEEWPVTFAVPSDVTPVAVQGKTARWVRVRLVAGGFGAIHTLTVTATGQNITTIYPDPPALQDLRAGYVWEFGPYPPQRALAFNDFQYEDVTRAAMWEGETFAPFRTPAESTPALYLGFDRPLPAETVGLWFDVAESTGDDGPALAWEHWDGFTWSPLDAEDGTRHLRAPGVTYLTLPADSAALPRFGTPRWWVRVRPREDGVLLDAPLRAVVPHAVGCVQRETLVDEPLGVADGRPEQVLGFRRTPVLEEEIVEVREATGRRAAMEWRRIAHELDPALDAELDRRLAGDASEVMVGPLRLRRGTDKRIAEVWVRWEPKRHLLDSGPQERHYALDRARGLLRFGDGTNGRVPPATAAVLARRYRVGGGAAGNLPAGALNQVLGAVAGVEAVRNVRAAEGGADAQTPAQARREAPAMLRHGGRAVQLADYEALAREASPAVARAWAVAHADAAGRPAPQPGRVTVHLIPFSTEPQPQPSFGLREDVRRYLRERGPAAVDADGLVVTGAVYRPVGVAVAFVPVDSKDLGPLIDRVRAAVLRHLHPVDGGPEGEGWRPGRSLDAAVLATVLESVPGVDAVAAVTLTRDGAPAAELLVPPPGQVICAGPVDVRALPPRRGVA